MKVISKYSYLTVTALLLTLFMASHNLAQVDEFDSLIGRLQDCETRIDDDCEGLMKVVADGSINELSKDNETLTDCCSFLKNVDTDVVIRDCSCIMEGFLNRVTSSEGKKIFEDRINILRSREVAEKCSIKPKPTPNCSVIANAVKNFVPQTLNELFTQDSFLTFDCSEQKITELRELCSFTETEAKRNDTKKIDGRAITATQCCVELGKASNTGCLCVVTGKTKGITKSTFSKESNDFVNFMTGNREVTSLCKPVTRFLNFQDCKRGGADLPTTSECTPETCANLNGKTLN